MTKREEIRALDMCDEHGCMTLMVPGARLRHRVFDPSRASRPVLRRHGHGPRARFVRRNNAANAVIKAITREHVKRQELAEIERILNELADAGQVVRNPDGSFSRKLTPTERVRARRERLGRAGELS